MRKYFAATFYRKQCSLLKVGVLPRGVGVGVGVLPGGVGSTRQKIIANSRLPFETRPLSWWKPQELDITPELKGTVLRSCKMSNLLHGENTEVKSVYFFHFFTQDPWNFYHTAALLYETRLNHMVLYHLVNTPRDAEVLFVLENCIGTPASITWKVNCSSANVLKVECNLAAHNVYSA